MINDLKKMISRDPLVARSCLAFFVVYIIFTVLPIPAFTPFLKFGMYSAPQPLPQKVKVLKLYVNGTLVTPEQFSIPQWDDLTGPFYQWSREQEQDYHQVVYKRKVLEKLNIFQDVSDSIMFNNVSEQDLLSNSAGQIEMLTGQKVDSFRVAFQEFTWNQKFIPVSAEKSMLYYDKNAGRP